MAIKKPISKQKEKKSIPSITNFVVREIYPEIKYFIGKDGTYMVFKSNSTNKKNGNSYTVFMAVTANYAAIDIDEKLIKLGKNPRTLNPRTLWNSLWYRTDVNYQVNELVEMKKIARKKAAKKNIIALKKSLTKKLKK